MPLGACRPFNSQHIGDYGYGVVYGLRVWGFRVDGLGLQDLVKGALGLFEQGSF